MLTGINAQTVAFSVESTAVVSSGPGGSTRRALDDQEINRSCVTDDRCARGNSDEPGVVVGAHMDTLSSAVSIKPGADDDGSGSVTVLETARSLLSSGMHFKKPLYLIWYSAEELGLIGSQFAASISWPHVVRFILNLAISLQNPSPIC